MTEPGYCHACRHRIGQRKRPCVFCGSADFPEPKQPLDAQSAGLVPVEILFPKDVYETIKARALSLSAAHEETCGVSEFVASTMRRALAG